jgi:Fe-S cluster assembly ATP-binding protein
MMPDRLALEVRDLRVSVKDTEILKGLDLQIPFGEVHAIMGPNGSGKSTLSHVLTGKTGYEVSGEAFLDGESLLDMDVDERARAGLMQAFQYPVEVPGVGLASFLMEAGSARGVDEAEMARRVADQASALETERFLDRAINDELSGGEKKRSEIYQMVVLRPKVAILDEIDSGLDIDAVRDVAEAVQAMRGPEIGIVMITHYSRILEYVTPDRVHVMMSGRVVDSGGPELADELEAGGYAAIRRRLGVAEAALSSDPKTPFDV